MTTTYERITATQYDWDPTATVRMLWIEGDPLLATGWYLLAEDADGVGTLTLEVAS